MSEVPGVAETVAAERAKLVQLRREFMAHTAAWFPGWYGREAYQFAAENLVGVSGVLGREGLRRFRLSVDELASQATSIVDFHLDEDVWWHIDEAMNRQTIIYSVRLCTGRLRSPLERFGYIRNEDWREAIKVSVRRLVTKYREGVQSQEWENFIEFYPE